MLGPASSMMCGWVLFIATLAAAVLAESAAAEPGPPDTPNPLDHVARLQADAIRDQRAEFAHWGADPEKYTAWGNHSNRLVPVYTFGTSGQADAKLADFVGDRSLYRDEARVRGLYRRLPEETIDPTAVYCDQTDLFLLQQRALAAGKKHIVLVVFDGMDWQTTQAAAVYHQQRVGYTSGRGTGLHLLDYSANNTTEYGWLVTSPYSVNASVDVDRQTVSIGLINVFGGYSATRGTPFPWGNSADPLYLITANAEGPRHAITDSACSATSLCAGIKSYNSAINVDHTGQQVTTIAHEAQQQGFAVGVVTSVPFCHATPAAAYAHNVDRDDYQDLARDLLGLPSISHPETPLSGMDVVLGGGFGTAKKSDQAQGKNFVPGNQFITDADLQTIDAQQSPAGRYVVALRQEGLIGRQHLNEQAKVAAATGKRLFGMYGVGAYKGHLPFQTANGDYRPVPGRANLAEEYAPADLSENPTLAELTSAALTVLGQQSKPFWLMVEAGDVDWANHDNNLDNSIGAVLSGDDAVRVVTDWVEQYSNWQDALVIVTADHGHYLHLLKPEALIKAPAAAAR